MADMFDALEKQSAMASARAGVKMPKQNPRMLAIAAKQEFKIADFSNSGRIDDDEALEVLTEQSFDFGAGFTEKAKEAVMAPPVTARGGRK